MTIQNNRIRALREERDIKQVVAANEMNMSRTMLCDYEAGRTPSLQNAVKLAQYYGVSLDYICGLTSDRNTNDDRMNRSFSALRQMVGSASPTATDVQSFLDAALTYMAADAPCGDRPIAATRAMLHQVTKALRAAATGQYAELLDASNAATMAVLDVARMPTALNAKQENP